MKKKASLIALCALSLTAAFALARSDKRREGTECTYRRAPQH